MTTRRKGNQKSHCHRSSKSSRKLKWKRGDLVYYYEREFVNSIMIVPGEIEAVRRVAGRQQVKLFYWWKDRPSNTSWKRYPTKKSKEENWRNMSDKNLSRRKSGNKHKIMLRVSILKGEYVQRDDLILLSWYDRHVREIEIETTSKKEVQQREQEDKARKASEQEMERQIIQNNANMKEASLLMIDILSKMNRLQYVLDRIPEASELPVQCLISKTLYSDAMKNKYNTIPSDRIDNWGNTTAFQNKYLRGVERIAAATGELLQTHHFSRRYTLKRAMLMVKRSDTPPQYSYKDWEEMERTVPVLKPFQDFMLAMTSPNKTQLSNGTFSKQMLRVSAAASSMSSRAAYTHPIETLLTKQMMHGMMERTKITVYNNTVGIGVTPSTVDKAMARQELVEVSKSNDYYLPPEYVYKHRAKFAIILKQLTDNYGQKVSNGQYATGCTVIPVMYTEEDLNPKLRGFVKTCSREEIAIAHCGLESTSDLGATHEVDVFTSAYLLSTVQQVSSLKELVDCADFAGEQKTNLKTYVQERKNNFSALQQNRNSVHTSGREQDGGIKIDHLPISPYWHNEVDDIDTLIESFPPIFWERLSMRMEWGFDGFGNVVQDQNLMKFAHACTINSDGIHERITLDPTLASSPLFINAGDGSPCARMERVRRMLRAIVASGESENITGWDSPLLKVQQVDPTKSIVAWTFDDGSGKPQPQRANIGFKLVHTAFPNKDMILKGSSGGNLLVEVDSEDQSMSEASFKVWCPPTGDKHDSTQEYYRFINNCMGLFHSMMAGLKRGNGLNSKAIEILASVFRLTAGQIAFLVNCGSYDEAMKEMGSIVAAILLYVEDVYKFWCGGKGKTPTPIDQLAWMFDLRNKSAAWDQILNICDNYLNVKQLRDACRSADIYGVQMSLGRMVEMFALTGGGEYFHMVTTFLVHQKVMSDYELGLQCFVLFELVALKWCPNDLALEEIQGQNARVRGKNHGLLSFITSTMRIMHSLPQIIPTYGGGNVTKAPPTAQLGAIELDARIMFNVREFLQKSNLGQLDGQSNLDTMAVNTHTGHLVHDDLSRDVVYDFGGARNMRDLKNVEDVGRVLSHGHWDATVFGDNCNSITKRSVKSINRTKETVDEDYIKALIEWYGKNNTAIYMFCK